MKNNKRIIFMGTPEISASYLQTLLDYKYNVVAVYSQPARPKGRGMKIQQSPVEILAKKNNLPILTPQNLNSDLEIKKFKSFNADLSIIMGYGKLLPNIFLEQGFYGCINIHLSLLPKWRGASPIEHALLSGDKQTGVTLFKLVEKLDAGPIISSQICLVSNSITKGDLQTKLNNIGKQLLIKTLPKYFSGNIKLRKQNLQEIVYASKITSADTQINFSQTSKEVYNKIRAFAPKPGAWFILNNERIKILSCSINKKNGLPSTIISKDFLIGCKDYSIKPIIIQREGKKLMNTKDFLRGFFFNIGDKIKFHA